MAGRTLSAIHTGEHVVVGGLFLQILFFGFFMIVALIFDYWIRKVPTPRAASSDITWRKHLNSLYGVSVLIMVRSIFRVVSIFKKGYSRYWQELSRFRNQLALFYLAQALPLAKSLKEFEYVLLDLNLGSVASNLVSTDFNP